MKRLLILSFLFLLTACSAAPAEKQETPPPEMAPTETVETPEVPLLPEPEEVVLSYRADTLLLEGTETAEDGTVLLTYRVQIPQLAVVREDGTAVSDDGPLNPAEEEALAAADAFNQRFYDWTVEEHYTKLAATAGEDLTWFREEGFEWYGGYRCELDSQVYQTDQLVSVSGLYYSYTGGAHPNSSWLSWNFDLEEGAFLGPELLADSTELRSAVAAEILRQARTPQEDGWVPAEEYWEDHEALIADWTNYAVSFDESGMTVVFSPYELAPYAAGPQEFHFPYDWLEPHLGPYGRTLLGLDSAE